jgi:MFS superfamily sulfate permease-like transporter
MRKGDWIAGISLAALMLPEAIAYAGIAGVAAQHAIYAAVAGCLAYALVGRSQFAIVTTHILVCCHSRRNTCRCSRH